jgi:hypothetical protein
MPISSEHPLGTTSYTDTYREACFLAWFQNGCPKGKQIVDCLPSDEHGRKPHEKAINEWMNTYDWYARADVLNSEVSKRIEIQAVEDKVKMLQKQAESGEKLQEMGMSFLDKVGFDKSADALRAIIQGAELERASKGLPSALIKISEMEDSKLADVIAQLMKKSNPDETAQFIEAEFKEEDDKPAINKQD